MITHYSTIRADRLSGRKVGLPNQPSAQELLGTIIGDSKMKHIPLTQGKVAIVDDEDFDWLSQWKWCAVKGKTTYYASRNVYLGGGRKSPKYNFIIMHRLILGLKKGDSRECDHRNHNGLDNQRHNLRICNRGQNMRNARPSRNKSSKYKGVSWHNQAGQWRARIKDEGIETHIGHFCNEVDAAKAYDAKAKDIYGEFAYLNFDGS